MKIYGKILILVIIMSFSFPCYAANTSTSASITSESKSIDKKIYFNYKKGMSKEEMLKTFSDVLGYEITDDDNLIGDKLPSDLKTPKGGATVKDSINIFIKWILSFKANAGVDVDEEDNIISIGKKRSSYEAVVIVDDGEEGESSDSKKAKIKSFSVDTKCYPTSDAYAYFSNEGPQLRAAIDSFKIGNENSIMLYGDFGENKRLYEMEKKSTILSAEYRKEKDEVKKESIKKDLMKVLDELFDLKQETRKKEIETLEKQLAKLKKALSSKEGKKKEVIERRLMQLTGESSDLDW